MANSWIWFDDLMSVGSFQRDSFGSNWEPSYLVGCATWEGDVEDVAVFFLFSGTTALSAMEQPHCGSQ